ncbi:hypothetical protein BDZ89DRAFT_1151285 [Hymenopellis radicata]|nr:hypothetical protein BDZ89DRAFT_1151285 [Hymenopellis radicata]
MQRTRSRSTEVVDKSNWNLKKALEHQVPYSPLADMMKKHTTSKRTITTDSGTADYNDPALDNASRTRLSQSVLAVPACHDDSSHGRNKNPTLTLFPPTLAVAILDCQLAMRHALIDIICTCRLISRYRAWFWGSDEGRFFYPTHSTIGGAMEPFSLNTIAGISLPLVDVSDIPAYLVRMLTLLYR